MKIDTFFRHVREAYRGVMKNSWMSFAAIGAVAVTLFIFGIFLIFSFNINFLTEELDKQVSIRVSLKDGLSVDDKDKLTSMIEQDAMVKEAQFVSKEEGLKELKATWGEDSKFLDALQEGEDNPLPDMIIVTPVDPKQTETLAKNIGKNTTQIERVFFGEGITDRLLQLSSFLRNVVLFFSIVLALLASFLISNTIKLTILARRREVEIMRLVGASNWFIRWPYFIEGAFIGIIGSIVPIALLITFYSVFYELINEGDSLNGLFKLMPVPDLSIQVAISTLAIGLAIGSLGSIISIRRFLKT